MRGLLAAVVMLCVLLHAESLRAEPVPGPYYFHWGDDPRPWTGEPPADWQQADSALGIPTRGGDTVWIAVNICDGSRQPRAVQLPPVYTSFDAFLGKQRLGGDHGDNAAARAFHLLDVNDWSAGCWLRLRIQSKYTKTGMRGEVALGTRQALIESMLRRDVPRVALLLLFLLGGVASLAMALGAAERRAFAGYGVWLIGTGLWTAFYTRVRDLIIARPDVWVICWLLGLGGTGIGFLLFFQGAFARDSKLVRWMLRVVATAASAGLVLYLIGAPTAVTNPVLATYRATFVIGWLVIAVHVIRLVRHGDVNARIYAAGLALFAVFSIRDILLSLGVIAAADPQAHWGSLVMFMTSGAVLLRRVSAIRNERDAYAQELAATARERTMMLRDLHDGLGRITTTISMLSNASESEERLSTIGELADEGSREIRTFMHALDDEERAWSDLEAQIRHATKRSVEAAEGSAAVEVDIESTTAPTAYLFVHVLRVLHEALTNAIKNSVAPHVSVRLHVRPSSLRLEVTNDGVRGAPAKTGVNEGAGLRNMRARAEELGGELALTIEQSTAHLELSLPLPVRYADQA